MAKDPQTPHEPSEPADEQEGPPFDPDPRLVTSFERGVDDDAEERFREQIVRRNSQP